MLLALSCQFQGEQLRTDKAITSFKKQQKFYSLPKRYNIRFDDSSKSPSSEISEISDEGPLLDTSNLILYRLGTFAAF